MLMHRPTNVAYLVIFVKNVKKQKVQIGYYIAVPNSTFSQLEG